MIKLKMKSTLRLIRHYNMNMHSWVEAESTEEGISVWKGGWVNPCASLAAASYKRISHIARNQTPSIQPTAYSLPYWLSTLGAIQIIKQTNSVALGAQANYTDRSTATCRRNLVLTFVDRGVVRGQRGGSPTVVNLSFLDQSRYFSFK
jgi:hypothetical protein